MLYLEEITSTNANCIYNTVEQYQGCGGDQYIGDCEIPISLISSLGHDVASRVPNISNDSYEQIAAPQKTGEICLIYTFSTSKIC